MCFLKKKMKKRGCLILRQPLFFVLIFGDKCEIGKEIKTKQLKRIYSDAKNISTIGSQKK
jgi:hypothetical protein